jgi:hypothetical protein
MGTAFRDIVLRLTEASIIVDQMSVKETAELLAEAARTIDDLRGELERAASPPSEGAATYGRLDIRSRRDED